MKQLLSENDIEILQTEKPAGYGWIEVKTPLATAKVALLGATLTEWTPAGHSPVIFTSESAIFKEGKGIRGGVPLCWPWFAVHPDPDKADWPNHGFVRQQYWELESFHVIDKDRVELIFKAPIHKHKLFPHAFELRCRYVIGSELDISLITENIGHEPFTFGGALHTYFTVADIDKTFIDGLDGVDYLDKVTGYERKSQQGPITISSEVDRIYLDTQATCTIHDTIGQRSILISKKGSNTTVVWNPWIDKSAAMSDLGDKEYQNFVCVETVNAFEDSITLASGTSHTLSQILQIKSNK
ncbi:MAG: D-hexose-6-phosphate mutarotase [Verrucomicrobiota bacterium]